VCREVAVLNGVATRPQASLADAAHRAGFLATWFCCIGVAALLPRYLFAQSTPKGSSARTIAIISGVALDSLREVPWSGAIIIARDLDTQQVDTTSADENGHFTTRAVGGDRYELSATDSLATVLGLRVTATLRARPDSTTRVVLTLRSTTSLVRLVCGTSTPSTGAVIGRVMSHISSAQPSDATVSVKWIATQVNVVTRHIGSVSRVAIADVDREGRFVACGLPVPLSATLVARIGSDSTTQPVALTSAQQFFAAALVLPLTTTEPIDTTQGTAASTPTACLARSVARAQPVAVSVRTTSGVPIVRAQITLDDESRFLTDSAGVAKLSPAPSRTHRLLVRKLGFAPLDVTSSMNCQYLAIHLQSVVPELQTIAVTGSSDRARTEFEQRARTGIGDYFTEGDIDRLKPECLLDLLKRLPGVQVEKSIGCHGGVSVSRGAGTINGDQAANGCVRLIVDGGPASGYDVVPVDDIMGVEFYDEVDAPIRYGNQCALIEVWTKEARSIN